MTPCLRTPCTSRIWSSATRPGWRRCAASRCRSTRANCSALLGPNGAGKSTLIHCTTGLAQPTAGSIHVFGHDAISDYGKARQAVGLAPQELNLDWFLTVEETLDYHAGYFGMPKRERRERTKELLETFSLTEKADERTRTLSGGMKRRLILARAMMHRPRLLILDEPTAGVDVELRLELWHYVQRINQEGTTILLTTHYLEEAEQLCDRIAFINDGQIVGEGTSARAGRALRRRQPRGRLPGPGRPQRALALARSRSLLVSAAQIRFATLWRREVNRFMKIKKQTLGAPLLETFLYIIRLRRRARLADQGAARDRIHRLRHPRPDHDGLRDQLLLQQLLLDPAAEVPGGDPGPALLARLAAGAAARLLARRLHARPDRRRC